MTALSVLHISTSDSEGGSARSARRIHESLRRLGHLSHMLVGTKASFDPDADTVHGGGLRRVADRLAEEATRRLALQYHWYPSGRRVLRHPWVQGADVIQLYNLHGGYISYRLLTALARRAPIIWRLSDMWPMTGHCAYSGPCGRWRTGCGQCPDLATYPPLPRDTTALLWRWKRSAYRRVRPTIVAPSRWIEEIARASPLFEGCAVHRIPNGLDLAVFRPIPKQAARKVLGLPPTGRIVLFSANMLDANDRKGSGAAIAALARVAPRADLHVALLGIGGESWVGATPHPVIRLGYIRDDRLLAAAYAAADLSLSPSSVENLPNSILESLACGTPVVAFDAGGIADAVRHRETGWLAKPGDIADFARGIDALLDDETECARLGAAGAALMRAEFDAVREGRRFVDLYAELHAARRATRLG